MPAATDTSQAITTAIARRSKQGDLLERLAEPTTVVQILLLAGGVVALFWRWFATQHGHSWGNPDWEHAYLVPLISLYVLWQSRADLVRARLAVFWPGLVPLLMGVWLYLYFIVGVPNHFGQGLALVLTIFGLTLLLLGPRAMEHLFLPIAYLAFAITIPEIIMNLVTYPLQDFAARAGYFVVRLLGVNADLAGNSITVYGRDGTPHALTVAEACGGMRTVMAFLALGTAVALVGTRLWWKRVVLVAVAVPVGVALNALRIGVLGLLAQYNTNLSEGEAHTLIGTALLVVGLAVYLGIVWSLGRAVPEDQAPKLAGRPA